VAARRGGPPVRPEAGGRIRGRGLGRLIAPLDRAGLDAAVVQLAARDADLAGIVERYGLPPLWDRAPGFGTLVHLILEQQVSLASAQAAFDRLTDASGGGPTPARLLGFDDAELLAIGFSRQKARYARALASAVESGALDIDGLEELDDDEVRHALEAMPGIGPWTSSIYLLMVLGRPDVWPVGDIALAQAAAEVQGLDHRPDADELRAIGEAWRPWRSVAARLLWHDYLGRRGRPG
jgi:DNA-3-methyladenine glycosylase II